MNTSPIKAGDKISNNLKKSGVANEVITTVTKSTVASKEVAAIATATQSLSKDSDIVILSHKDNQGVSTYIVSQ